MTIAYNLNIPLATNNPSVDQPNMETNTNNIATYVAVDHVAFNAAGSGQHNQVTFNANNVPSPPVSPPVLFTNNAGGPTITLPQLFFYSGSAANGANQYVAAGNGSTFLLGGIILKWGGTGAIADNGSVSFVNAFPNNCFSVLLTITDPNATSKTINIKGNPTQGGFTVRVSSGSVSAFYIAVGN